ncbi:MAG: hypothetical protein [Diaphorina citri cimodo-like virus]|nr:MAG: hypothetical protein [Diaphorina citri cimodo-like virus]
MDAKTASFQTKNFSNSTSTIFDFRTDLGDILSNGITARAALYPDISKDGFKLIMASEPNTKVKIHLDDTSRITISKIKLGIERNELARTTFPVELSNDRRDVIEKMILQFAYDFLMFISEQVETLIQAQPVLLTQSDDLSYAINVLQLAMVIRQHHNHVEFSPEEIQMAANLIAFKGTPSIHMLKLLARAEKIYIMSKNRDAKKLDILTYDATAKALTIFSMLQFMETVPVNNVGCTAGFKVARTGFTQRSFQVMELE